MHDDSTWRLVGKPHFSTLPLNTDFLAAKKCALGPLPPGRFPPVWQDAVKDLRFGALSGDKIWDCDHAALKMPVNAVPYLDPQLRMALEVSAEALHDSGIPLEDIRSGALSVGVFTGKKNMRQGGRLMMFVLRGAPQTPASLFFPHSRRPARERGPPVVGAGRRHQVHHHGGLRVLPVQLGVDRV